ncbi:hypothetical protein QJS10_CPB11g01814 [Acorus calamus]|uniref:Uncharacterized protein n=1 Tax=Acorus calamus TaxID=4465 RepID=A0AAV9DVV3_ACOCL|nr:hypothetical protein QJS10_CPB11g01814 [Acorus calamus]
MKSNRFSSTSNTAEPAAPKKQISPASNGNAVHNGPKHSENGTLSNRNKDLTTSDEQKNGTAQNGSDSSLGSKNMPVLHRSDTPGLKRKPWDTEKSENGGTVNKKPCNSSENNISCSLQNVKHSEAPAENLRSLKKCK